MKNRIAAAILGGTGYGAQELVRLLVSHPEAELVAITSRSNSGVPIAEVLPQFRGVTDICFQESIDAAAFGDAEERVLFSALPHGVSGKTIESLYDSCAENNIRIIDLSGDYRLQSAELRKEWYPHAPSDDAIEGSICYGLTELHREDIPQASIIANPGCLAAASILTCAPLMSLDLDGQIAIDAKTGSTGSGKDPKPTTHHPLRHGNFRAYKPLSHQHEPEIAQALQHCSTADIPELSFVAQSIPIARGIFVSVHAMLSAPSSTEVLLEQYKAFYNNAPCVRVSEALPEISHVVGTNYCDLSVRVRGKQVLACGVIDNLGKGMASQAIQNMNVLFGREEMSGLPRMPLGPCV